ncbi:MAG: peptide deformylase [Lactobacillales bacterium]|nr:peptide deformylase [Lactobacillales bacterium]
MKNGIKIVCFALMIGYASILFSPAIVNADVLPVKMVTNPEELKILKTRCERVTEFDDSLAKKMDDLDDTLAAQEGGAGIAANQVGYLFRAVVLYSGVKGELIYKGDLVPDPEKDPRTKGKPLELINPEIIHTSGEQMVVEGCFSIPSYVIIVRPKNIKLKAYDRNGLEFTFEVSEEIAKRQLNELKYFLFSAHLIFHECEHLDGILCSEKAKVTDISKDITDAELSALFIRERQEFLASK